MSFRLGLTGGIAMGKSTAAGMFRDLGHPVWDADAAVHRLYAQGGAAVGPVADAFPDALRDGAIDREALKQHLQADPPALKLLESIVHPLVAADRQQFIDAHADAPIVVLDIPLLFETGAEMAMDGVATVSVPARIQRERVMARPGMTEEVLNMILSRQLTDADRRARADWIIPADNIAGAKAAIMDICTQIMDRISHA